MRKGNRSEKERTRDKKKGGQKREENKCNVIFMNCKWVFNRWQWFTIRHNKQNNTHHTK
jgi:hypothetical protein